MAARVHAYLAVEEKLRFDTYAGALGFKVSEIAKFLISRELHVGRLTELIAIFGSTWGVRRGSKVTAHVHSEEIRRYFIDQAERCGLSCSQALAILIREELAERRFEAALQG